MKTARLLYAALAFFLPSASAPAQGIKIPAGDVQSHLLKHADPKYPPLAETAHIQGITTIRATISKTGKIINLRAVSGHPVLMQAAIDAVRTWQYEPFLLNGEPVEVETIVNVFFALGPHAEEQRQYYAMQIECREKLNTERIAEAVARCNDALSIAHKLSSDFYRMEAYGNAGVAGLRSGQSQTALDDFQEQLRLAKKVLDRDAASWGEIHLNLARGYRATEHLLEADQQFKEAEKALQETIKSWGGRSKSTPEWMQVSLKQAFTEHAALMRQTGNVSAAEELERRANSIPNSSSQED